MRRSLGYLVLLSTATASAAPAPDAPGPAPAPAPASSIPIDPPMLPSTAPGTQPASPRPASWARPGQPARIDKAPSPLVPLFVGTALGSIGIYAGGRLGIAAVNEQSLPAVSVIALGALAGGSIAVTVAVMSTAGDDVHESSIAATWGGSVLGCFAGAALAVGTTNDLTGAIILTGGAATLGAWIGHQVSQRRRDPSPIQLTPVVTTHTTGLALSGQF